MADDSIYIDPHFFKPPNVVDLRDSAQPEGGGFDGTTSDPVIDGSNNSGGAPGGLIPLAPSTFTIIEQTVRQPAGGNSVIDMVIEVPDQLGVVRYEVRLSKQK